MSESAKYLTAYVNILCIEDPVKVKVVSILLCAVELSMMAFVIHLLHKSKAKVKAIVSADPAKLWDRTYCEFALYNIKLVQILLVVLFVRFLKESFKYGLVNSWYLFYFPANE